MPEPSKIAFFLATSGHSGVDRAMSNLLPALAARGYRIDLIRVREHGPHLPLSAGGVTIRETRASHVYSSFPFLCSYLKSHVPDVLFTDKDRVNRTALLARGLAKVTTRFLVSIGTTVSRDLHDRSLFERQLQKLFIRHLYPQAYKFLVTSQGVARDVQQFAGRPIPNLEVVPRPMVSQKLFEDSLPLPDHPWYRNKAKPIILGVGELSYRKDFATLLKALAEARKEVDCRLMILGEGKRRAELLKRASHLGLQDDFALPGFVQDPYPFMAHADVFALTSLWEGLPFVLVEALAVGTPVVSVDCPSGPGELLQGGLYGPLVPVGDEKGLARSIIDTLKHPLPKGFLQQAARPYEIERSTDAYLRAMGLPLGHSEALWA